MRMKNIRIGFLIKFLNEMDFYLPIFRKNMTVNYKGTNHIIEDIFIRQCDVFLKLNGIHEHVRSDKVDIELTKFTFIKPED